MHFRNDVLRALIAANAVADPADQLDPATMVNEGKIHPHLWTAYKGNLEGVKIFIEEVGIDVDAKGENNYTVLQAAADHKHCDMLDWLLSKGADTTIVNNDNMTAYDYSEENRACLDVWAYYQP